MKLSNLNSLWLLIKIVLPALLCFMLLQLKDVLWGFQFVLIFGIIIIPFNLEKLRKNFLNSLLLSILMSFMVLFLAIGIGSAIDYIIFDLIGVNDVENISILNMQTNDVTFFAAIAIVSPILMFYCFRFLFRFEKSKYTIFIQWMSVIILVLLAVTNSLSSKDNSIPISWQLIMTLALQFIIYEKELKKMLRFQN